MTRTGGWRRAGSSVESETKTPLHESNWFNPTEAPLEEDLSKCVHCGLCVNSCPTYLITGLEVESPRGRIYFARGVELGQIEITPKVQTRWDHCLQCRACEAVCPSGVPYGKIAEGIRAQGAPAGMPGGTGRRGRRLLLRHVIANRPVLALAMTPARWAANSPVRRLAGLIPKIGPLRQLVALEAQLPRHIDKPFRAGDHFEAVPGAHVQAAAAPSSPPAPSPSADGEGGIVEHVFAGRALLFTGCVMGEIFGDVHRATARVLNRTGVDVEAPAGQVCCGALHAHDGDIDFARKLARKNIDLLEGTNDPIVVNSAGCGAAMKEYGQLLEHDAKYADRAKRFGARVVDPSEYLAARMDRMPASSLPSKVTYQDPCHLAHAQRIRNEPRALIDAVAGCERKDTSGGDVCCGAAGIYSLVQPEMSAALRTRKADQFREAQPEFVITANPGCQMQYEAAVREAGIDAEVLHLMQFLDRAQTHEPI